MNVYNDSLNFHHWRAIHEQKYEINDGDYITTTTTIAMMWKQISVFGFVMNSLWNYSSTRFAGFYSLFFILFFVRRRLKALLALFASINCSLCVLHFFLSLQSTLHIKFVVDLILITRAGRFFSTSLFPLAVPIHVEQTQIKKKGGNGVIEKWESKTYLMGPFSIGSP